MSYTNLTYGFASVKSIELLFNHLTCDQMSFSALKHPLRMLLSLVPIAPCTSKLWIHTYIIQRTIYMENVALTLGYFKSHCNGIEHVYILVQSFQSSQLPFTLCLEFKSKCVFSTTNPQSTHKTVAQSCTIMILQELLPNNKKPKNHPKINCPK